MTGTARLAAPRGVARPLVVLATTLLTAAACASAGPSPSTGDAGAPPLAGGATSSADRAAATELLTRARAAYDAGDYAAALSDADEVVARYPATPASSPALLLAARAALEMEDFDGAERRARRYAELFPGDAEGARPALDILDESARRRRRVAEDPGRRALVLGVIVPESGSQVLERYGELVVQGATLAAEAFRAATERDVELRVRDDGADEDVAADLVPALESGGADAILGPLLSESLLTAAGARGDLELPIVSPTASDHPIGRPNAFTLNAPNALEAERLADHARERGFTRVALLYPRTAAHEYLAAAFRERLASAGMQPVLDIGYPEDKTTFRDVIAEMEAARAEAVYAPATQRGVRQLAPQLAFLSDGATRIAVLGNDVWAAPETLRLVEADALEGVVVATSDPRTVGSESYEAFVARYEATYRRTLDNPFPALGYDATTLLLAQAAARQGGALAPGIEPGTWYRGATGAIGVRDGVIVRRPYLVRIEAGRAVVLAAGG